MVAGIKVKGLLTSEEGGLQFCTGLSVLARLTSEQREISGTILTIRISLIVAQYRGIFNYEKITINHEKTMVYSET